MGFAHPGQRCDVLGGVCKPGGPIYFDFFLSADHSKLSEWRGAYIVAKDNLGALAGDTAGAALSVDYIMTVAVSVSSGVEQITSAFLPLRPYTVPFCIAVVLLLMLGNLRGIRESSRLFGLPAYAFVFGILAMLITGILK